MDLEKFIGTAAGILTSVAMLPQLINVIRSRETANLSLATICVLMTGVSLWVYYGSLREDLPVILSNSFSALVNAALLVCFFLFRDRGKTP